MVPAGAGLVASPPVGPSQAERGFPRSARQHQGYEALELGDGERDHAAVDGRGLVRVVKGGPQPSANTPGTREPEVLAAQRI